MTTGTVTQFFGIQTRTMAQPQPPCFAGPPVLPSSVLVPASILPAPALASASAFYILSANLVYLARRSQLRNMPKRTILRIRTTREPGVSRRLFFVLVISWQLFVLTIFPLAEPVARLFGRTVLYYTYPNAHGAGIILEPLDVQHLPASKRTREQIRFDWHRFSVNRGGVGRDGYRHPPAVKLNLPHIDLPRRGLKHWPWRRKFVRPDK